MTISLRRRKVIKRESEPQREIVPIPPRVPAQGQQEEKPMPMTESTPEPQAPPPQPARTPAFGFKHQVEAYFAEQAEGGVLVEVGVDRGEGVMAMIGGSGVGRILPIYAVDPYRPCSDAFGSTYDGSENKAAFLRAVKEKGWECRVFHIEKDGVEAARGFDRPVAFLWVDLGLPAAEGAIPVFDAWAGHVVPGGVVGVPGLEHPRLEVERFIAHVEAVGGWERVMPESAIVAAFRKRRPKQAVFYLASDDHHQYVAEARRSAASVKEHLSLPTYLFYHGKGAPSGFDSVRPLPPKRGPFWYLDSTRWHVQAVRELWAAGYEQLLYLDTDTLVCYPCMELFDLLGHFDLAMGQSPQRDCVRSAVGAPASFCTLEIGVNLTRRSPATEGMLADWLDLFERFPHLYDNNDNGPLRDALWLNPHGLKWTTLAPEYALRFDFGCWAAGKVRILHGREGGRSGDLRAVAEAINGTTKMRLWNHGLL